jgi:hypothetical protein
MKTKLSLRLLLILALCPVPCALCQIPQGFNYQAIVRNTTGDVIPNQNVKVKVAIHTTPTGGSPLWDEEHTLLTSQFGLVTFVVGTGPNLTGSITDFSKIPWNAQTLYLRTYVQYPVGGSYTEMGTTQIWSVPYSLVAKKVEGPVDSLTIRSASASLNDAIFEVKNKSGQTVFAVYNEGVRVYVSDGKTKGLKGGFAVGGFGTDAKTGESTKYLFVDKDSVRVYLDTNPATKGTKGTFAVGGFDLTKGPGSVQNYLNIGADSIRMYIDKSTKGLKGGFAVGGFDMTKGSKDRYLNIATDAGGIINPAQNRILWYPLKNAFMTGKVLIQSISDVGENSFAAGYTPKAKGQFSQAMGFMPQALGDYSTAIGKSAVAEKTNSFAFGNGASAKGMGSYAFGTNAEAQGDLSFALGSVGVDSSNTSTGKTIAKGYGSFAIGFGSYSSGQGAITLGVEDTASGDFSSAIGYLSAAKGWGSSSLGYGTKARGIGSIATGWGSETKPDYWFAWGAMANNMATKATNFAATSFGDRTLASGHTSFATGYKTTASGHLASTFGDMTTAVGDGSVAMGHGTTSQAYGSLTIGRYNIVSGTPTAWNSWEPVLVIGNGTSSSLPSNAMTVYKNGIADFAGYLNVKKGSSGAAMYVNGYQAIWYDYNHFSWGYDGSYNFFATPVTIGGTDDTPSYTLTVKGTTNSTGGYVSVSDARWKKDIEPLQDILPGIVSLQGVKYNWRKDEYPAMNFDEGRQIGLIAQDLEKIFPELVKTDNNGYKAVSYEKLTVVLLEGMKEQQKQIDELKALVDKLLQE